MGGSEERSESGGKSEKVRIGEVMIVEDVREDLEEKIL